MRDGGIACLSFTERGRLLSQRLCDALGGEASCTRDGVRLRAWTEEHFSNARALVFVGAAGIAVRAVAPLLRDKACDPAVVAVDEGGTFAVPLLSGHLGGANELARAIARVIGATAVITTATDVGGVFAADEWARINDCAVVGLREVKSVSGRLLAGEPVTLYTAFSVAGELPEGLVMTEADGADVRIDIRPGGALTLAPRCLILGVGCRRGVTREALEERFAGFCRAQGVLPEAVCAAASIDLKQDEDGLLAFCAAHGWKLNTFSAEELSQVEGTFSASDFVAAATGVDNVCERGALLAAGAGGELLARKSAGGGVTFALAKKRVSLEWRRQDG